MTRKPRDLKPHKDSYGTRAFWVGADLRIEINSYITKPKELRRIASWLLRSADWLESRDK